ncbi:MAG: hypothetical protein Q4G18_08450 [Myroides sp.]|nr:hypothetical protein [Myroides sp.]
MIKSIFILLLFSSFCHAQIKSKNDLDVIGYINENINYPKNWFVEFKADSINLISSNNDLLSVLADNKVTRDSIVNLLSKKKDQSFTFKYKDEAGFDLNYTFFKAIKNFSVSKNASKILLTILLKPKLIKLLAVQTAIYK